MLRLWSWAGFNGKVAPSVHVDWSYYGGAESLPPERREALAREVAGAAWMPPIADKPQAHDDFLWALNEEPHRTRRMAILRAHPEVRRLMGYEPLTKYVALFVVTLQIAVACAFAFAGFHPLDWRLVLTAYVLGGTANQNLFLAVHEITHNLAFRSIVANRTLAIVANLPITIPFAMMFKPYHIEHHKYLGEDGIDTDLPTQFELMFLNNVLGKTFFATFQLFFYALRPGFVRVQRLTRWHAANFTAQLAFDAALFYLCGRTWTPLVYLLLSSFFAGSLHPLAGHFIAEHYMFSNIQQETWSYYGPLNWLAYNVGYHNEHHDFPSVPWTRLPALHKLAPEFYKPLPCHTSWTLVILEFIFCADAGVFARVKRRAKQASKNGDGAPEDKPGNVGWETRS